MRGLVIPLTPEQVVTRALYLVGEKTVHDLDEHVLIKADTPELCPTIYYRLQDNNGGKDPKASDPATRWQRTPSGRVNVTSDCMGGAAWCSGFDRFQPVRLAHLYGGWVNTNSMSQDAAGHGRCFRSVGRPEPGSMIVCRSGTLGHEVGHVGVVVAYQLAEWDPSLRTCWDAIEVVDIAGRQGRANMRTTGRGWRGTGALFVRSIMTP